MSTQYNGKSANIAFPGPISIASSTNASPIVVTTSTAHGLSSGDTVDVSQHQTNTAANGIWPITVLSPTTFSLTGSHGIAAGTLGSVQGLTFGATYAQPSDGDAVVAASVDVALETLGDQVVSLLVSSSVYALARLVVQNLNLPTSSSVLTAWATLPGTPVEAWASAAQVGGSISGIQSGDIVEVSLATGYEVFGDATGIMIKYALGYALPQPGVVASPAVLPGSGQPILASNVTHYGPITLLGSFTAANSGSLNVYVGASIPGGAAWTGGNPVTWVGDWTLIVKIWRYTGLPV